MVTDRPIGHATGTRVGRLRCSDVYLKATTAAAMADTTAAMPDRVVMTSRGAAQSPWLITLHSCGMNVIFSFCHLCWRRWQPSRMPEELFRHIFPPRMIAPHQTGASKI